jgi:threonine dehydratase
MSVAGETVGLSLEDVRTARERIAGLAVRTPIRRSRVLAHETGKQVVFKMETFQPTGAFKLRGAANFILNLTPEERRHGVATTSSGNHGRAVAYVARELGIPAAIFLSALVPANKVAAIADLGAEVVVGGKDFDEATHRGLLYAQERGMTWVHAFDDPLVAAGQGVVGLEILEDVPDVATVVVPTSGGGLIGGIALALKSLKPDVTVVGVTMERGPAMYDALRAGRPVEIVEEETLADALSGSIGIDNKLTFGLAQRYVNDVMLVSEEQIAEAMAFTLLKERFVLEGAGATSIALLRDPRAAGFPEPVVAVCSGDNVDMKLLLEITQRHLG